VPVCQPLAGHRVGANHTASCVIGNDDRVHCWDDRFLSSGAPFADRGQLEGFLQDVQSDPEGQVERLIGRMPRMRGLEHHAWGPFDRPVQIVVGEMHACVLEGSGAVACWGINLGGQLGDGTTINSEEPVRPRDLPPVRALAAGRWQTCAATCAGEVLCWGQAGELDTPVLAPKRVERIVDRVRDIVAGPSHVCALMVAGTVSCWGFIGGEGWDAMLQVVLVPDLNEVVALSAGRQFSCALRSDGAVWCFGATREAGMLGDRESYARADRTVRVEGLMDPVVLATGERLSCAVERDGDLVCWGEGAAGFRYGPRYPAPRRVTPRDLHEVQLPLPVAGAAPLPDELPPFEDVAVGWGHICGLSADALYCWGYRQYNKPVAHRFPLP
jgi:alpha-tubulin suppressor-like RCC1 family protein